MKAIGWIKMRNLHWLPLILVLLPGCNLPEDDWGIVKTIWNDFPWWSVVWRVAVWTLLGVFVGILAGLPVSILLRRIGAYRLPWPRVWFWLTAILFTLNTIALPILCGAIGFFEGMYNSAEVGLRQSRMGKEWLPVIAAYGSSAIIVADMRLEAGEIDLNRWEEIHEKQPGLNVVRMLDRLDPLQAEAAGKIAVHAKAKIFAEYPDWQGTASETVIDWTLPPLLNYLLNRKLQKKLADYGVPDFLGEMRAEARADGDDMLTHAELTRFLTDRVLIRMVLYPLRKWLSSLQTTATLIILAWFAVPMLLLSLTRWINFWVKRQAIRRMCVDRL